MSIGKFSEFYVDVTKDATKIPQEQYLAAGRYPIIDQGQKLIAGMWDNPDGLYEKVPAIVFGDHTRTIKYVDTPFFIGADGVKVLRPVHAGDNVKYLFYVLQAARIPNLGYSRHFKVVKELEIRMYPRKKQDEIVRVLEQIDSLLEQRQNEILQMDILVKSRFVEMFGDIILNPFNWEKEQLGMVCDVRDGTHDSPQYYETGYPLVTSKNVTGGKIDLTDCSLICEVDFKKINERSKVDIGDIIMPMIGTVGKPVIVDVEPNFAIKNVSLIKFKDHSTVLNIFICALLQSDYFDNAVLSKVRGGTQKFISLGDIRKLAVIVPPMALQEQFAAFVAEVDKSKFRIQKSLLASRKLWTMAQIDAIMNMDFSTQRSL